MKTVFHAALLFFVTTPSVGLAEARRGVVEICTDLLIVGGTESGWAAAIQAARLGVPSIANARRVASN